MMALAVLAPVPEEHLLSALDILNREGRVAFGSTSWELFEALDSSLAGADCEVLIYASDASRPLTPPSATWTARYLGSSRAVSGAHKDGMKYRPMSTSKYPADNKGHWVVFWEVANLVRLETPIVISKVQGYEKPKKYLANFIPHGPLLIEH